MHTYHKVEMYTMGQRVNWQRKVKAYSKCQGLGYGHTAHRTIADENEDSWEESNVPA